MRYFLALIALAFSLSAHSKPVMEIFFDGLERHEAALVSNSAARCAALFYVQSAILTRDTNETQLIEQLQQGASELQKSMVVTNGLIKMKRGVEVDNDALLQEVHQQTTATMDFYTERMKANQLSTGEMWGQDELIKADMEFCPLLTQLINSDAWFETVMTDDWSFWDENL